MPADVAQGGRAQHGIGDRMQQRVRIRMALQAERVRDLHSPENELAARHQRVRVPAFSDANVHQRVLSSLSASEKSWG